MQNPSVIRTASRNKAAVQSRDIPWSFLFLVIVCACVVAAGFFFAARQHFTSMEFGIKNSKLREQLESLEAEKRRLLVAREVALSPLAMKKAAREIGLRETSDEVVAVTTQTASKLKAADKPIALTASTVSTEKKSDLPKIVPTVINEPVQPKAGGDTRRRVVEARKEKREKVEVAALLKLK